MWKLGSLVVDGSIDEAPTLELLDLSAARLTVDSVGLVLSPTISAELDSRNYNVRLLWLLQILRRDWGLRWRCHRWTRAPPQNDRRRYQGSYTRGRHDGMNETIDRIESEGGIQSEGH